MRIHDPGLASLKSAVRAAIVLPSVFAFADKVIAKPQVATFAAFGSFALLVLVEFSGPFRSRVMAYLGLAAAGAANISIGTLCSNDVWLATVAMAVIGFVILFSGIINGYFAAATTSALLTFILAAMIPAPASAVPDRLEGFAIAAAAGIAAQLLIWPVRVQAPLRHDAAVATAALADLAETELAGNTEVIADRVQAAGAAVRGLRARFLATPHRPTGPTAAQAALNSLVDELDWVFSLLAPPEQIPALDVSIPENAAAVAAAVQALRASAATLDGRDERPDLDRLRETRHGLAHALIRDIVATGDGAHAEAVMSTSQAAFRIRALSGGAEQAAEYALVAAGHGVDDQGEARRALSAVQRAFRTLVEHANPRDVWFRNSLRSAIGLAAAVYVAQRSGVQHGFWVVLGTLSVLRSNALGTGWSIISALAGTVVGIVIGSLLVIAIGSHEGVLWAVLPFAVLLGSYAPRAISFAAGQAGFTVVLFVLFNILQPVGWRVGLVRLEDIAIGCAISLGVGLLFWPRGAGALLRDNIAASYSRNADYVVAAERELVDRGDVDTTAGASAAAATAAHRLDDAYRQSLTERAARPSSASDVVPLLAGAARVRRAAGSLSTLAQMSDRHGRLGECGANLDGEANAVRAWYVTLGDALIHDTSVPPPHAPDNDGRRRLVECVREALATGDKAKIRPALDLIWAGEHLDALRRLEDHLSRHAAQAQRSMR
jgi:uncharacterized membrane protein YccC